MNMYRMAHLTSVVASIIGFSHAAFAEPMEIYCNIRGTASSLTCQVVNRENRQTMTSDDISAFIDAGQVAAYITLKSRKGMERTYLIDPKAPQYKKLNDLKRSSSISEKNTAKAELFNEIEKRVVKLSDELDAQAAAAELVKYDSSIVSDKMKRDTRAMSEEIESLRKKRDKNCAANPAVEQTAKANASLQQTLSNILHAFESPDSCMTDFKVFKDKDGSVDLRQLDGVAEKFAANCKKK